MQGETNDKIDVKDFILNTSNNTIEKDGKVIELTKNELKILQTLMENKEKIVSRDDLMAKIWESDDYIDENMPEWARKPVQAAVDKGILKGDKENGWGLTYEDLKVLTWMHRAGIF